MRQGKHFALCYSSVSKNKPRQSFSKFRPAGNNNLVMIYTPSFYGTKKSCPSVICWDRNYIPAVPPGLTRKLPRPLFAYYHMQTFVHGESCSGAHTGKSFSFLIALGSPFNSVFLAVIPPATTLCKERDRIYLLFLIGLFDSMYKLIAIISRLQVLVNS